VIQEKNLDEVCLEILFFAIQ